MNVKNAIVQGENYRFTVLTPSMIRMEYSEKGVFVDKKTQMVVNRTFDVPEYTVNEKNGELIIETDKARLVYTGGRFAGNNLRIEQRNQKVIYESTWHYGDIGHNLREPPVHLIRQMARFHCRTVCFPWKVGQLSLIRAQCC